MITLAENDKGEVLGFDGKQWRPPDDIAVNDKGEKAYRFGNEWEAPKATSPVQPAQSAAPVDFAYPNGRPVRNDTLDTARIVGADAIGGVTDAANLPAGLDRMAMRGLHWLGKKAGIFTDNERTNELLNKRPIMDATRITDALGIPTSGEAERVRLGAEKTDWRDALGVGARFLTSNLALGAGGRFSAISGIGAGVGQELGGETGALIGGMGLPLAPSALALLTRGALRGGRGPDMRAAIRDSDLSGMQLTAGQSGARTNAAESLTGKIGGATTAGRTAEGQIQGAERTVRDIAGEFGPAQTPYGAGADIIAGTRAARADADALSTRMFAERDRLIPNAQRADAQPVVNWLQNRVMPSPGAEATVNPIFRQHYDNLLAAARASHQQGLGHTVPVRTLRDIKSSIDMARSSAIQTVSKGDARQFYGVIDRAIMDSASPAIQQRVAGINRMYGGDPRRGVQGLKDRVNEVYVKPVLDRAADPASVAREVSSMAYGAPEKFRSLMRGMPRAQADSTRAMIIGDLGGREGRFTLAQFRRDWAALPDRSKSALFDMAGQARYRQNLDAIIRNYDRIQRGSKVYSNPSGTAGTAAMLGAGGLAAGAVMSGNPVLAVKIGVLLGTSALTQRLLASPRFVRWLAGASSIPPANVTNALNTLIRSESDSAVKADLVKYRDSVGR